MTSFGARVVIASSNAARKLGNALDGLGAKLEVAKYTERLVPSSRFVAVNGISPSVSENAAFIAPSANVIGDVTIGTDSSIWYGATVRGDVNKVSIGCNTSIGDRAVVHVAKIQGDLPTIIGDNVTIEPGAVIHACTLNDSCWIGSNAQVLDGSVVETNSMIAPGSVVSPGTKVESNSLYSGLPAKKIRALTESEVASIKESSQLTLDLALEHSWECAKDVEQLVEDEEMYEDNELRNVETNPKYEPKTGDVLGQGVPGMIFDTSLSHPEKAIELMNKKSNSK